MFTMRNALLRSSLVLVAKKPGLITHIPQRLFATDADIKKQFQKSQIIRTSKYEPKAADLIQLIRLGKYEEAKALVAKGVDVNGHTSKENTALTDAAKRGDVKGVRFLMTVLKANPHASCDCPDHKTPLHYAAEEGHIEVVKELLINGANPNALDSRKYTAIDVSKTHAVKIELQKHECVAGIEVAKNQVQYKRLMPK